MKLTKRQIEILNDMIKEYELLARYNTGKRDHERYSLLCDICKEVKEAADDSIHDGNKR